MKLETVTDYYSKDHDRLDELFKTYQTLKRTDFPKAKEAFLAFEKGLRRHIVWEEQILFPLFEEKTGMHDQGPTAVMRIEHRQIQATLDTLHQKMERANLESDTEDEELLSVLFPHNLKEENVLYPMIDRFLASEEARQVFQRMEQVGI